MNSIKNSLDWSRIEIDLIHKCNGLVFQRDVRRMIDNIRLEIKELSIKEVQARRGNIHRNDELIKKINQDIEMIEGFILVAALIG